MAATHRPAAPPPPAVRPTRAAARRTAAAPRRTGRRRVQDPDLLARLRAPRAARGRVDPALVGGLRAWLEDGAAGCGPRGEGRAHRREETTPRVLRGALARALFRLVVTGASPERPFEDALAAAAASGSCPALLDAVGRLGPRERGALRADATADARAIVSQWRPPPASWLPRTAERLRVPLAAGAVVLCATADLVLGAPSSGTASVCLVEVDAAAPCERRARSRRRLALAETLRSGAPPFRVATYHPGPGVLVADDVTEALLVGAVEDALEELGGRPS